MFYDLNRNSVDIDLDLLDQNKEKEIFEKIQKIVGAYGKVIDSRIKRFNLVTIISYDLNTVTFGGTFNRFYGCWLYGCSAFCWFDRSCSPV